MKKHVKRKSVVAMPQDELDVAGLIDRIQQQLSTLEEKLDILISQSSKRPFEKSYPQKPSRGFNRPYRNDRGRRGSGPSERTFTRVICASCKKECEIPFKPSGDRPVYCRECFPKNRQSSSFNASRDSRPEKRDFPQKRPSDKGQDEKRQRPAKKKPFYARIKSANKQSKPRRTKRK